MGVNTLCLGRVRGGSIWGRGGGRVGRRGGGGKEGADPEF